jgi:ElaB/YqjD/DUF883 family membrane-anchored ribosome-binding protein
MTTKEEVNAIASKRMLKHIVIALICLCADAYLSSMPWASVALWTIGSVCLATVGFLAGVIRSAEAMSK